MGIKKKYHWLSFVILLTEKTKKLWFLLLCLPLNCTFAVMKVLTASQIQELDAYTIEYEPISSIELMERASLAFVESMMTIFDKSFKVIVFSGTGGNGGDALSVSRLLNVRGYTVEVYFFNTDGKISEDCRTNRKRLIEECPDVSFKEIDSQFEPPMLTKDMVVVDGLFGIGLNKPLSGGYASLVKYINNSSTNVVSIDIPSGLMAEDNSFNVRAHIIRADYTFTFQFLKLAFLLADNAAYLGKVKVLDVGLHPDGIREIDTQYSIVDEDTIGKKLRPRSPFAHKGHFGHALLVAGSYGMAGAAILSANACLKSGAGKLTIHTPKVNNDILQIAVPCAVLHHDTNNNVFSSAVDSAPFQALGIGCGIGATQETAIAFIEQVRHTSVPLVVDADGLNILAGHKGWIQQIPKNAILTPHPKELQRLLDNGSDSSEMLRAARDMASRQSVYIILKGHNTAICTPQGKVFFNTTGNPGMATAGSGDVLTGLLVGLLSQGYSEEDTCILGCYIHGLAGDLAVDKIGEEGLTASDIVDFLPSAFRKLKSKYRINEK